MEKIEPGPAFPRFHRPAFGRANLVEKLGPDDDDDRTAPIGDGVAKKGTEVSFRIEVVITDYPNKEERDRNDTE